MKVKIYKSIFNSFLLMSFELIIIIALLLIGCSESDINNPTAGGSNISRVTDIDGNIYNIIQIGDQWWMTQNLKVTRYRNGEAISHVTDPAEWKNKKSGAYCSYNNDENKIATYGLLYNWYAVKNSGNIAPEGWHVPTDSEWRKLEMYLGMSQTEAISEGWRGTDEGGKLKESGTAHWRSPNTGATNASGFKARPGGYRDSDYAASPFGAMGSWANFWSSTSSGDKAWHIALSNTESASNRSRGASKGHGFSVRCVRD